MTNRFSPRLFYLFGLFLLSASLPYSKFLMSISQFILFFSWLFDGNLSEKLKRFMKNKTALLVSSVFILHLIGLTYTTDFEYGLEDVRKKIPILLLPLLFSTSAPLTKQQLQYILFVFVLSVISATVICFYVLLDYSGKTIVQPQHASIFISHIRFALLICLTIFILGYFFTQQIPLFIKILIPLIITWLIVFLFMLESATGIICTIVVALILVIRFILTMKNIPLKIFLSAIFMLVCIVAGKILITLISKDTHIGRVDKKNLPIYTKRGNIYTHDTTNFETENGNYIWHNICEKELEEEWNKKSSLNYHSKDLKGNDLKYTLIRFLTSKGLNKDAEGVNALSKEEVNAIEKGTANVNYMGILNPMERVRKILWELDLYLKGGNPSGHSVVQRIEFWKAALGIIKENFLFGVGTGDVLKAFDEEYEKINSPLTKEYRLRSHNQFLAIGTAFGIVGIIWFLFSLFYPLLHEKKFNDYFYITFFTIAFLSMLAEDTLETQAGVTFFSFFNSLFLFLYKKN